MNELLQIGIQDERHQETIHHKHNVVAHEYGRNIAVGVAKEHFECLRDGSSLREVHLYPKAVTREVGNLHPRKESREDEQSYHTQHREQREGGQRAGEEYHSSDFSSFTSI